MPNYYLGTIGFGYKDWVGPFYPPGTPSRSYLSRYSQVFNAVELDTTFYGSPDAKKVATWGAAVPDGFVFCPKTPRRITHDLKLAGPALVEMQAFLHAIRPLGAALGPVLIQMPPDFAPTAAQTLSEFLRKLPAAVRYAVEFRHPGWYAGAAQAILPAFDVAQVIADYPTTPDQAPRTADFLYVRWLGQHGKYNIKTHEREDRTARLQWWWQQLQPHLGAVQQVYGFFNNDYSGFSPATCNRFKTIIGQTPLPLQNNPQLSLF